jgi:hypothetical protein
VANSVTIGTFQTGCFLYRYSLNFAPLQKLFFGVCLLAILFLATAVECAIQAWRRKKIIIEIDRCKETPPAADQVFSENLKKEALEITKEI